MQLTFDDIVFTLILVFPIALFYYVAKKHWIDKELKKAFIKGIIAGIGAIFFVRLLYIPIELRTFLSTPRDWYITLIACIGIIGFVEEGIKAMAAHLVCCFSSRIEGFRPTFVFMSFAGCALSFSFLENIQYYMVYGSTVVLPRILVSSIAHLGFACICSYFSAKAFHIVKAPIKTALLMNAGVLLASVLHGTFDFMLFKFSILTLSGLIIALLSLLLYIIYEIWIAAMKYDLPPIGFLAVCSGCRALTVERIRFCPFCGNRVKKIEALPTIIREISKE